MTKIKQLLSTNSLSYLSGAHDSLSAIISEKAGFDGIWASGLGISATHGVPDMSILTMSDFAYSTGFMTASVSIPVICDCDAGYGNIHNVAQMVKKYEQLGVGGVCIEDKKHPKLNSFINKDQQCETVEEFCAKIKVANYEKRSSDFAIIARCESLIVGLGMEEALLRSRRYVEAGANAILIHSKKNDAEEIMEFIKKWNSFAPLIIIPTTYPELKIDDSLASMGVCTVIFANQALRASVCAMQECLKTIYQHKSTKNIESKISSVEEIFSLQGLDRINLIEKKVFEG